MTLLPSYAVPSASLSSEWRPTRHPDVPAAPPEEEPNMAEIEMAAARQSMDGRPIKKTRPRRTVDFNGSMGRWHLLRKLRPSAAYVPYLRPAAPYIINLLPPAAYLDNPSTSLCTKFVHTSTNKVRVPVNAVVWTPEARRLLTGSTSGEFTLWNGLTFNFETILQAHDTPIRSIQFTHSGAYLASTDQSGIIKYFQPNMNNLTAWQGHQEAIRGLSFSPDDRRFVTASDDSTLRLWDFQERREERVFTGHGWDVKCVEWHPTKGLLVSGSKDSLVKFWDPRTGTVLSTLHQHKNTVQALSWSPNGNMVASASRDQTVRVFDIRAMKEFRVLKGHKKEVCSVTWHPIHPLLVSGGSEGSLIHWDLALPESSNRSQSISPPRATLDQAHDSNVWSLAFHPLGHILASASNDHTTRFWSRERPGDASSVFSGGGEKPPDIADHDQDEDDEYSFVPGFGEGGASSGSVAGGLYGQAQSNGMNGISRHQPMESNSTGEDFIPGFGVAPSMGGGNVALRQGGPLPSQQEMLTYGAGGGNGGYGNHNRGEPEGQHRGGNYTRGAGAGNRWGGQRDRPRY